jgi:hypothetical protein
MFNVSAISEYSLDSMDGVTKLTKKMAPPTGSLIGRTLIRLVAPVFIRLVERAFEAFRDQIEDDFQARTSEEENFQLRKQSFK